MRNLEQNLEAQVEMFFPKTDTKLIIELIGEGDEKCLEVAARMVDITGANVGDSLLKVESVLKNVLFEVAEALIKNKKWLEQFVDFDVFKNISFAECKDMEAAKEIFLKKIEEVCSLINLLQCGRREKDIVSQITNCVLTSESREMSLKIIAEKLFMNKTYISEAFKQKTGISFVEYLTRVKMEKAKRLLMNKKLKAYEIGDMLGYKDIEYFSKLFKKYTGVSPKEFRQKNII